MSKKFDAEAYVASWDAKVIPAMLGTIIVSLVLVVLLNIKTRPDCLRHEYVFCGTEEVLEGANKGHEKGSHGNAGEAHEPAAQHGEAHPH